MVHIVTAFQSVRAAPQTEFFLDDYPGASLAVSVRRLSSTYGGDCVKAREAGGGTTQDIGFGVSGLIDTVALTTFAGSNSAFVETWYDQSGAVVQDCTNATTADQPRIYNSLTGVITAGGIPAIDSTGGNIRLLSPAFLDINGSTNISLFVVCQIDQPESTQTRIIGTDNTAQSLLEVGPIADPKVYDLQDNTIVSSVAAGVHLYESHLLAGTITNYYDGTNTGGGAYTRTETNTKITLFNDETLARGINGQILEVILYESDQTPDRADMAANIASFYGITLS